MKKKLMSSAILGLGFMLVAPAALAADTQGKIEFGIKTDPGTDVILPDTNPPVVVTPDPGTTVTPGPIADGLNFSVPHLDFGTREILMEDKTYNPKALKYTEKDNASEEYYLPPTVIVRDLRGKTDGEWDIKVSAGEFIKAGTSGATAKTIQGAQLTFVSPRVFSNKERDPGSQEVTTVPASGFTFTAPIVLTNAPADLISATGGAGNMQTTYMLDKESKYEVTPQGSDLVFKSNLTATSEVKGIDLKIPGGAAIDNAVYSADITWTMTTAP
ncbi:WxL domain-containing protein [uncultured Vagococcus sp.]|uniref:WxL domain-containing protein n=1 Tax=uncultured Vagococcus sp. TaxID=189676 RepID=UPI0028D24113|nr:WxL domain-containing protein [uncultured Vagococcus sp.]